MKYELKKIILYIIAKAKISATWKSLFRNLIKSADIAMLCYLEMKN